MPPCTEIYPITNKAVGRTAGSTVNAKKKSASAVLAALSTFGRALRWYPNNTNNTSIVPAFL